MLWTRQTSCEWEGNLPPFRQTAWRCSVHASVEAPYSNLVCRGRVVLKVVVAGDRKCPRVYIQDHVAETAAPVFVAIGNQCFEVLLQVGSVVLVGLAFLVGIFLALAALDIFGGALIAAAIEMDRDKRDSCSTELVAFRQNRGF